LFIGLDFSTTSPNPSRACPTTSCLRNWPFRGENKNRFFFILLAENENFCFPFWLDRTILSRFGAPKTSFSNRYLNQRFLLLFFFNLFFKSSKFKCTQIIVPASDRQVEVVLWCRSQLLSAGLDGFIVLYDLARLTAKKLVPSIGGAIWCMTRNKSETKIVVGTEDGYVVLFDIQIDGILFDKSFNKQDCMLNIYLFF
jgi:hypothetical protein